MINNFYISFLIDSVSGGTDDFGNPLKPVKTFSDFLACNEAGEKKLQYYQEGQFPTAKYVIVIDAYSLKELTVNESTIVKLQDNRGVLQKKGNSDEFQILSNKLLPYTKKVQIIV